MRTDRGRPTGHFPDNEATYVATPIFERWTVSHAVIVPRAQTMGPQNPIERIWNPNDPFLFPSKKERERVRMLKLNVSLSLTPLLVY